MKRYLAATQRKLFLTKQPSSPGCRHSRLGRNLPPRRSASSLWQVPDGPESRRRIVFRIHRVFHCVSARPTPETLNLELSLGLRGSGPETMLGIHRVFRLVSAPSTLNPCPTKRIVPDSPRFLPCKRILNPTLEEAVGWSRKVDGKVQVRLPGKGNSPMARGRST